MYRYLAIVLAVSISSPAWGEEIPLNSIWGLNIPGTQDVRKLDPPRKSQPISADEFIRTSLVEQIKHSLDNNHSPKQGEKAGRAFVVMGTGLEALREAQKVLAGDAKRIDEVPANKEITLVVYKYNSGRAMRLDGVDQQGNKLAVRYHLKTYDMLQSFASFALIPIGKLEPGKVEVAVEHGIDEGPSDLNERHDKRAPAERIVSRSFDFAVTK